MMLELLHDSLLWFTVWTIIVIGQFLFNKSTASPIPNSDYFGHNIHSSKFHNKELLIIWEVYLAELVITEVCFLKHSCRSQPCLKQFDNSKADCELVVPGYHMFRDSDLYRQSSSINMEEIFMPPVWFYIVFIWPIMSSLQIKYSFIKTKQSVASVFLSFCLFLLLLIYFMALPQVTFNAC